ncbi:hypothetical protein RFM26_02750 [Mesorhizobium sp. VK23B]|uniref:PAS domain-containing protein n=1 Tax=Mesorhizobium dulcispinae TaxID=3072316 RepID=A0ABU4XB44_9HYPH|nr:MULTISPECIES: PAS domain-containing protein [unclassified Mesorhizobium]MDX8464604.1 hypothetical protein [Mesorhizobium sp. VK23B]MDX8470990.1 hypothetical protein [Mesorhizobium sp. VK23A]
MGTAFDLQAIGAAFAEAAVDSSRWDMAMELTQKATGSVGTLLLDMNGHLPHIPRSQSTALTHEVYVRDGWIHRDERYRLAPLLARHGIATDLDLFTPDNIAKHPYYQEFLAPFGLRWCALVKVAAGDIFWCLSLQRSIKQGPFSPGELAELADFSRHLGSTAALAQAMGFARVEAASDAFDASGTAVIMMDQSGKVIRTNSAAEQLLGPDLQVSNSRLVSAHRDATVAIQKSLWQLLHAVEPASSTPPVALPRIGRRPLLAHSMVWQPFHARHGTEKFLILRFVGGGDQPDDHRPIGAMFDGVLEWSECLRPLAVLASVPEQERIVGRASNGHRASGAISHAVAHRQIVLELAIRLVTRGARNAAVGAKPCVEE